MPGVGLRSSRRRVAVAVGPLAVLLLIAGLVSAHRGRLPPRRSAPTAAAPRPARSAAAGLPTLSLKQLAGQRIIYAYAGLRPPPSLIAAIRAGEAAGVILFSPNISSQSQIRSVVGELQGAALASPVHARLLILTDQEGGEVRRLPGAPAQSEREIGLASNGAALAQTAGLGAGRNLAGAGINVNLAPVLDVYRQAGNFIDQYGRSFGSNPAWVAMLGGSFIAAQQRTGVAATAKHFPGLGAATQSQDTDRGPVTLRLSLQSLRSVDERPYGSAIAAGVKLVMTSWATYPALDPRRPAGLSPIVIDRELRGRLHFKGVTITDAIDAGALTPFGSLAARSVLAASAGADLILCPATNPAANSPQIGLAALAGLTSALTRHQLSRSSAQLAAMRILSLRRSG